MIVFVLSLLGAPAADLDRALELYQGGNFAESITLLDRIVQKEKAPEAVRTANLYLAMNFLALNNTAQAKAAMTRVLDSDPEFRVPVLLPPKVKAFFAEVKAAYRVIPELEHNPPASATAEQGITLSAKITRMQKGYAATVYYRGGAARAYSSATLVKAEGSAYTVTLPAALLSAPEAYTLDYFFDVRDAAGHVLATLQTQTNPFHVGVSVAKSAKVTPVYKQWWLWTIVSVVAAGGAAAAVAIVMTRERPLGDARVSLRIEGAR